MEQGDFEGLVGPETSGLSHASFATPLMASATAWETCFWNGRAGSPSVTLAQRGQLRQLDAIRPAPRTGAYDPVCAHAGGRRKRRKAQLRHEMVTTLTQQPDLRVVKSADWVSDNWAYLSCFPTGVRASRFSPSATSPAPSRRADHRL